MNTSSDAAVVKSKYAANHDSVKAAIQPTVDMSIDATVRSAIYTA
jgi:hypothetical protein